ncbi:MAG: DUF5615 family PIN-like protein [bacterium]|nr:DUF5615 family PIN-like protein [bacterium]
MKLVIDENVSYGLVTTLRSLGYEVIAIAELSDRGMKDTSIFDISGKGGAVIITRDYHFTNPFRFDPEKIGGIIYIRPGNLKSDEEIGIVVRFLQGYPFSRFKKKLVILYRDSVKIRERMGGFGSR